MKCAIVGGGASGLVAAISALKKGANVTIYEKNLKIGRKLLATGNGRCNITNKNINISHYHGEDRDFINSILTKFTTSDCKNFFRNLGLEIFKKDTNRYYPLSLQASSVVDCLVHEVKSLNGKIKVQNGVKHIEKKDGKFLIFTDNKKEIYDKVLISTGSCAMPKLGGCEDGYMFGKMFGHELVVPFASLVQIVCFEDNIKANGVKIVGDVKVLVDKDEKISTLGDILFTKYGLSGSAILDISRSVGLGVAQKREVEIFIDCIYTLSRQEIVNFLQKNSLNFPSKPIVLILTGLINKKLALLLLERLKIPPQKSRLNKKDINNIAYNLKNLKFRVKSTKGADFAEVMAGGVSTLKIDQNSLESKIVQGLYFSGEVLDVDGDCGGFNLHWAWATGFLAGLNMAKRSF